MRNLLRNHDARLMVAGSTLSIPRDRVMFMGAALSTMFDYRILYVVMAGVFGSGAALFVGRLAEAQAVEGP